MFEREFRGYSPFLRAFRGQVSSVVAGLEREAACVPGIRSELAALKAGATGRERAVRDRFQGEVKALRSKLDVMYGVRSAMEGELGSARDELEALKREHKRKEESWDR